MRRTATRAHLLAAAILTVGVGTGAALFTLCWDVLLRPLPYTDPESLVTFWASDPARDVPRLEVAWDDVRIARDEVPALAEAAAASAGNFGVVVAGRRHAVQLQGNIVSAGFYELLGVRPALGRPFTAAEHQEGGPGAALLTDAAWQRDFGADPTIVGRSVNVDGTPVEIVGVLPPRHDFPVGAEIVFPLEPFAAGDPHNRVLIGLARLAPGATAESAQAALAEPMRRREEALPNGSRGLGATVVPLDHQLLGRHRPALLALLAMSALLLGTAAANAAGLLLHRGLSRRHEVAVRQTLGAGRSHLARLFGRDALRICMLATVAAAALAAALLAGFRRAAPAEFPRLGDVGLGPETLLFLLAAALLVALLLTALPLLAQPSGRVTSTALRGHAPTMAFGRGPKRGIESLVVAQVALAVALVAAAALAAAGYRSLAGIDPGFARAGVLTAHVPLGYTFGEETAEAERAKFRELLAAVERLPGVEAVGSVLMRPLEMELGWDFTYTAQGQDATAQERNPMANLLSATPAYFAAMGIEVLHGRPLAATDTADQPKVAVVSATFARQTWGEAAAAVGKRLKSGKTDSDKPWVEVVGVVEDVRYRGLQTAKSDLYVPYTQSPWRPNYLAVKSRADAAALAPSIERLVAERYPGTPLASPRTTEQLVDAKLAQPRLDAAVLAVFSAAGVLLAGLGLYAGLAYLVRQRRRELSIRLALGATPHGLLVGVLAHSARLVVAGALVGGVVSFAGARLLQAWLHGLGGAPAMELAFAVAALAAIAWATAMLPARRAAATDPLAVLE